MRRFGDQAGLGAFDECRSGRQLLRPGKTYYAYDPDNRTYWTAAGLEPISFRAQVASQDAGAHFIFRKTEGGSWTAFLDGIGVITDQGCP
jgi:hypothetical protein